MRGLINLIGYCWRWLGTAMSFALFGIGSLFLGVVVMPLVRLLVRDGDRRMRWSRMIVGNAMRGFRLFMNAVGVLRYEITGWKHVDKERNYLIIANHPSLIDVVFLLSMFPDAECVIKEGLRQNFFTRHLMYSVDYISNVDPVNWLEQCVDRLKRGRSLILFPEGTRTNPDKPLDFKAGAGSIAARSGAACLPIIITCEPTTLTKSESWYEIPDRRVLLRLAIQPPFTCGEVLDSDESRRVAGRTFNEYLLDYFSDKLNQRT